MATKIHQFEQTLFSIAPVSRKQALQPQGCTIRTRVLLGKSAMVQGFLGFSSLEGWAGPK
jgi:hypothetical protein